MLTRDGVSMLVVVLAVGCGRIEGESHQSSGGGSTGTESGGLGGGPLFGTAGTGTASAGTASAGRAGAGTAGAGTASAGARGELSGGGGAGRIGTAGAAAETGVAGGAALAGGAGATAFPPRPLCGGRASPANQKWCTGIENIALVKGELVDASADGRVSPGEQASIVIEMRNSGVEFYNTPCLGLLSDNPDVAILGGEAHQNPEWDFFGILPGQTLPTTMAFRIGPSIAPGSRVRFVAWVDVLNAGCGNGGTLEFEIEVQ